MRGELTFSEQALRDNQTNLDLLVTILKGRLDKTDPKFKDLVSISFHPYTYHAG